MPTSTGSTDVAGSGARRSAAAPKPTPLIVARSLVYHAAFFAMITVCLVLALPGTLAPRAVGRPILRGWALLTLWMLRVLVGQRFAVIGAENIPPGGAVFASKHQSAWETIALLVPLQRAVFVLKAELMRLPLWGRLARSQGMIAVDRAAGSAAMLAMARAAEAAVAAGGQLVIFPEGTRRPVGAPPDYKPGVVLLYSRLGVPCVPVAHNSGVFWPHGSFIRYPGTITLSFLPALRPDLTRHAFLSVLTSAIETETDRLVGSAAGVARLASAGG